MAYDGAFNVRYCRMYKCSKCPKESVCRTQLRKQPKYTNDELDRMAEQLPDYYLRYLG